MNSPKGFSRKRYSEMPSTNRINTDDLLPQTKDDLKQQIFRLTSALSIERSRNKELHRQKLSELKQAKNELERQKEWSSLIFRSLDSKEEVSFVSPEGQKLPNTSEKNKLPHGRNYASEGPVSDVQDKRASTSLGVYSSNSPYVKTISSLQLELQLLRESKKELEQRLRRIEARSSWLVAEPENGYASDQSFILPDQSYAELDESAPSTIDRLSDADVSSPSRRIRAHQVSDDLNSTFIIEPDFNADEEVGVKLRNQSSSTVGSERQRAVKEAKYDRDAKESERHWQLQKKVTDLNAQSTQLEKRVTALKEENEILKKKMEDQKSSEEKTKQLKRRNSELASIARRLEEKLKQAQQDSPKKLLSASPGLETSASKQTSQKTKLKERARSFNDKDKVVETMRERFQELLRHHQSIQEDNLMNKEFYSEQKKLENVIKVAAKERLQLEKQLVDEQHNPEIEAQLSKTVHLEQRNLELTDEVERLAKFAEDREKLEVELMQRRIEVETLERRVVEADKKCAELNAELQDLVTKNAHLMVENTDMKRQIGDLDEMAESFNSLSAALAEAEMESERAKGEASALQERVQTLEVEIQYLDQAEQKKRQLESEKRSLQEALEIKDQELESLRKEREYDCIQHDKAVKNLELRIAEVEDKYMKQLQINEAMGEELKELREMGGKNAVKTPKSSVEIQTDLDDLSVKSGVAYLGDVKAAGKCISKVNHNNAAAYSDLDNQNSDISREHSLNGHTQSNTLQREHEYSVKCTGLGSQTEADECDSVFVDGDVSHNVENGVSEILQVFQAMFDYDPVQCSPNEEPEAELLLAAGDYMFVHGDMDEDGFYFAELLDGRQGLVPSNFVRKLSEKELVKFYSHINLDLQGVGVGDHSEDQPGLLDFSGNDDSNPSGHSNVGNMSSAVVSLQESKELHTSKKQGVPDAPVNVQVDSGPDHGCLMVSWLPVTITTAGTSNDVRVAGYVVYLDDKKVKYLPNPTGDNVLLELEDFPPMIKPRSVTVRTVGVGGRESGDSLPAVIPPRLLHELNANNNCQMQENANEYAKVEEDLSVEKKVLKSENFQQEETRDIVTSPEDLSNGQLQELEGVKLLSQDSVNDNGKYRIETQITINKEIGHSFDEAAREHPEFQNFPETALVGASAMLHLSRDDGDVLDDTGRCSVWRKVSPKSKLNATFDASDLTSSDLDLQERTWKSLDAGDSKTVFVKTQSQEILGVVKKSDMVRYSSHSDVLFNSGMDPKNGKIGVMDENNKWKRVANGNGPVRASPGECLRERDDDVFSDEPVLNKSPLLESTSLTEHVNSEHSDLTSSSTVDQSVVRNGIVRNEVEDRSSCSELNDNNIVTSKKIRDDLPDSELIDFSDDGGESLMENVDCESEIPVRIFIALFSYDPATMSPNPDAVTEELPFREGQIIKIFGEKDQDGFFLGEIDHQRGLVPCNMISEVHFNDPEIAAQLLQEGHHRPRSHSAESSRASSQTSDFTSRTHSTVSMMGMPDDERLSPLGEPNPASISEHYVIALYDYDPQELSPNTDVDEELSFQKGDIIKVLGDIDDDGFYYGQLNGRCGLIPSNFVKDASSSAIYNNVTLKSRYLQSS